MHSIWSHELGVINKGVMENGKTINGYENGRQSMTKSWGMLIVKGQGEEKEQTKENEK